MADLNRPDNAVLLSRTALPSSNQLRAPALAPAAALVGLRHGRSTAKLAHQASVTCHALVQLLPEAVGCPNPVFLSQGAAQDTQGLQPV
jgi:hypothetical protein